MAGCCGLPVPLNALVHVFLAVATLTGVTELRQGGGQLHLGLGDLQTAPIFMQY